MNSIRRIPFAVRASLSMVAAVALICVCTCALGAEFAHAAQARPVSLSDARVAPSSVVYVLPGRTYVTEGDGQAQCGGSYWTETSAYGWDASALSGQRWNAMHDRTYWLAKHGRVVFDGVAIHNHTSAPILFAGWCS